MNIADSVRINAQRNPQGLALAEEGERLDWAALERAVAGCVQRLSAADVAPGDVVALSVRANIAHTVLTLALARIGATSCALDWRARPAERQAILAAVSARHLIADHPAAALPGTDLITFEPSWLRSSAAGVVQKPAEGDAPLMLLLTSGTTGQPRALVLSHEAAAWRAIVRMQTFGFQASSRILNTMPLHASATVAGLLGQILAGAATIFAPALFAPDQIVELLKAERIDHVGLVPTVLRQLLSDAPGGEPLLDGLQSLVTLGAVLHPEEKGAVMARLSPNLHEYYGSAISGPIATGTPADNRRHPGSVGRAPMFVRVDIVDGDGNSLPVGEVGRVRVHTPGAAGGHAGPGGGEQGDAFSADGVYPGDLGRLDDDGYLFLEGRAASLIIRGGQNVQAEEVERVLLSHDAVAEAAVIGRPDGRLGEVPVALIVVRGTLLIADLELHCRRHLTPHKVPVDFKVVPALPRTSAGKVHRAELAKLLA